MKDNNKVCLGKDNMKNEKMNLDMEVSEMEFKIEPFGYEEKDNVYCELKFYFQTNPDDMIELLKNYKKLSEIQKEHWQKDENGEDYYQSDIWNLKLQFLRFEEDE